MVVILNNKKSTYSGPNAYYTVETTNITNRTQTSVDISFKITVNLGNSESLSGTSRPFTGGLYLNGSWQTFTIKNSSTSWSGTTKHYINVTKTVSGLTSTQTNITGVQFRSLGSSQSSTYGGILTATACSDIEIPSGHTPPALVLTSITETDTTLVNLGVANDVFVPTLSQKTFTLTAQLYDDAIVQSYKIKQESNEVTAQTSTNPISIPINYRTANLIVNNNTVTYYYSVTDSKDATTTIGPYTYTVIPYAKPIFTGSTNAKRNGQTSGLAQLNISGTYFDGQIGSATNDITIKYKFYEVGSSSSTYYTISSADIVKSDGTFQVSSYEIGSTNPSDTNYFDYLKQYVVEIVVEDNFNSITIQKRINKGIPVWTEYSDRVHFEKLEAKDTNINGSLDVVGSITLNGSPIGQTTKNILQASLHSNYSITSTGVKKLTMADIDFQQGSALSISDGGIKIGAGITKVKVSGGIYFGTGVNAGDSLRAYITYNDTSTAVATNYARAGTNGTNETRNLVPMPITVQENDIIYLCVNNATAGRGTVSSGSYYTYLIVEEI